MATDIENVAHLTLEENGVEEDIVDPWNVVGKSEGGVDYDKLISMYNLSRKSKMNYVNAKL